MKLKCLLFAVLVALSLTGCYGPHNETPTDMSIPASDPTVFITAETEPETIPETVPTEPSLNIPAGAYPLKYDDPDSYAYFEYYAFIPENATENMPLVIFLHGDGEVKRFPLLENNDMMVSVREIYGNEFPFIAISPCTREESWIDWPIPKTLLKLIEEVVDTYSIDKDHIIITGHSRGAVGVWHMINTYGDYFSAAVPISCFCWKQFQMETIGNVPIRAFCGNSESFERTYSRLMREQVDELVLAGCDAEFTLFDGATHAETPALSYTEDLFQWALSQ